jgi:uncharacterized protein
MDLFHPVQILANKITLNFLGLESDSYLNNALNFFIYDVVKIGILLILINFLMAIIRYYLPVEKIKDFLTKRKWYGFDYFLASFFGSITPFCSCSSIPLFVGFLSAGIPLGVTLSFLITSPLINQASIAIFIGLFGFKITLQYIIAGILIGTIGGFVLGKMKLENYIDESLKKIINKPQKKSLEEKNKPFSSLTPFFWQEGIALTKKIFPYVLLGVGIGAVVHGYIPIDFFEKYLKIDSWWAVPVATILAVPLYSNAVAVIPIMEVLISKGVPFGTALAFMMATVGLSLPEALILKKAMKLKLLASFFSVVTIGIIIIGYLFNYLQ